MLRTFIQVFSICLTLLSSGFWIRGAMNMRDNDIASLSRPMFDYNIEVAKNLCHQRADSLIAFFLLTASAIFQMINLMLPVYCDDLEANRRGVVWAFVAFIIVWIVMWGVSEQLYMNQFRRVEIILKEP